MNTINPLRQLGRVIREQRLALELSQEDLAERSGLHRNYVGGIERGERNLGFINLVKIAAALDLSLTELMHRVESV